MAGDESTTGAELLPGAWNASIASDGGGVAKGPGQVSAPPHVDADIDAIKELQAWIRRSWPGLSAPSREFLGVRLKLLTHAVEHRETDSRAVREALQQVLLNVGTGALSVLHDSSRHRLAALTGIALPRG